MRRLISALALVVMVSPALAADGSVVARKEKQKDPLVGRWRGIGGLPADIGDGLPYGLDLKKGGKAQAVRMAQAVGIATLHIKHWRQVDATHIELAEIPEVSHAKHTRKVLYEILFDKDGNMTLKSVGKPHGMCDGTYSRQP